MVRRKEAHVAVVDDDPNVRRALARLIGAKSFRVKSYASAREFISSLDIEVAGCLVVDLQMPEMNGLQLMHYLAGAGQNIPTIVVTAADDPGVRHRCELAGAMACFFKPVSGETLLNAIEQAMQGARIRNRDTKA